MTDDEKIDREELWKFYEKAIEGRNAHYAQYLKYVNLYAIFTGALLVAFYHLVDKPDYFVFAFIIAVLGLISSILWMCSVKGYYAWIINWITVVKFYEEQLNLGKAVSKARFVYGLFFDAPQNNCSVTAPVRYSTQKLTLLFVFSCIMGWIVSIVLIACKWLYDGKIICFCFNNLCTIVAALLMVFALSYVIVKINRDSMKDYIDSHYLLKFQSNFNKEIVESSLSIHPPKNKGE